MAGVLKARFEFKYRVPDGLAEAVRSVAAFHLEPDPFGGGAEYLVNSLYLDSPDWLAATATREGEHERTKVRLRFYAERPNGVLFLENKSRHGASILKARARVTPEVAQAILRGETPSEGAGVEAPRNRAALDRIRNFTDLHDLRPRLWVRYWREAWVSPYGDGARLTFDRCVEVQAVEPDRLLEPAPQRWVYAEQDGRVILELKFDRSSPRWMQDLVHGFDLARVSCSKYYLGALRMGGDPFSVALGGRRWKAI